MKPIHNFSNYLLSSDGRVLSKYSNKYLTTYVSVVGYPVVDMVNDSGASTTKLLHRLLAEAYIPNPLNHPQVNHIDGNKLNNDLSNLEWVSCSENIRHAFSTGLTKAKASIDYSEIPNIVEKLKVSGNWTTLAQDYGLSSHSILRKLIKRDYARKGLEEEFNKLCNMINTRTKQQTQRKLAVTVNGVVNVYESLNAAARALGCNPGALHKALGKQYKGMEINYA